MPDQVTYLSREEATNVIRGIFRRCGYAVAEHGTKGQDLDLIAVPWTDRAGIPALIVDEVVEALDGTVLRGAEPGEKPHGRLVWTIIPGGRRPHDMWYVDLGVIEPRKQESPAVDPTMLLDALEHPEKYLSAEEIAEFQRCRESIAESAVWFR